MICKNCGSSIPETANFCPVCGTPTKEEVLNTEAVDSAAAAEPAEVVTRNVAATEETAADTPPAVPAEENASADAEQENKASDTEPQPEPVPEPEAAPEPETVPEPYIPQEDAAEEEKAPELPPEQVPDKNAGPKKRRQPLMIALCGVAVCAVLAFVLVPRISEQRRIGRYNQGAAYLEQGDYAQARDVFTALGEYEDAPILAVYAEKGIAYTAAKAAMTQGEFDSAISSFERLSGFKDSEDLLEECRHALLFEKGRALFEAEEYEAAIEALEAAEGYGDAGALLEKCRFFLVRQEILDAMDSGEYAHALSLLESDEGQDMENRADMIAECRNGVSYAEAEEALANGLNYTACKLFQELGSYRDARSRAEACVLSKPATGETYHNSSYTASGCSFKIDPKSDGDVSTYFKIYAVSGSNETLVSSVFINGGDTASVKLPAGVYVLKTASSTGAWYGEKEMFGSNGVYQRLKSSDTSDLFNLERYGDYVLTLRTTANGNVGSERENMSTF